MAQQKKLTRAQKIVLSTLVNQGPSRLRSATMADLGVLQERGLIGLELGKYAATDLGRTTVAGWGK